MNNEEKILQMLAEMHGEMTDMRGEMTEMRSKMDRMEETLKEVDARSARTQILLETEFSSKLQLLYEGQQLLQQTLAPKERVDVLEDEVFTLKTTVKQIANRVAELEKAQ